MELVFGNNYQPVALHEHFTENGDDDALKSVQLIAEGGDFSNFTFLYNQLKSDPSPKSCLYFQDFQGSKLFNCCFVV